MTEKISDGLNPPQVIGAPARGSSKLELYEYHKTNGTLGQFYELYPELRPREPAPDRGGRER